MSAPTGSMGTTPDLKETSVTTSPETTVERVAAAIANVIEHEGDYAEAARAALEAAQPSPAIAERQARLLLTEAGVLPPVHTAWREPLEPFCGNPDGFGPGGHTTYTLRVTCRACNDKFGTTEDELAEWDRWTRDGIPADRRIPGKQVIAEMRARRGQ